MSIMSVLLGVIDEPVGAHPTSMFTNKVGGEAYAENVQEIQQIAKCLLCGNQLNHITQIYCPLADSLYHRTLNIYACVQKTCWNKSKSWKVFRRQVLDKALSSKPNQASSNEQEDNWGVGEDDWGVGQDDWGDADGNVAMVTSQDDVEDDVGYESNDDSMPDKKVAGGAQDNSGELATSSSSNDADAAASQMQQLLIDDEDDGDMQQCIPEDIQISPDAAKLQELLQTQDESTLLTDNIVFEPYFISVIDEPKRSKTDFRHEERLFAKYKAQVGFDVEDIEPGRRASGGGDEKYEKTAAKHGDVTFYKFMKKVELQPDQILRYEWNGKPLHINARQQVPVPPCEHCGKPRIFELQLMPSLIPQLKSPTAQGVSVEYGTALVYVCPDSCWTDELSFIEECIQVEADPDQDYFK